jgi:histidinol-phosphate aminotransferase
MQKLGVAYTPAVSNFFMMSVKGMTGTQVGAAMQAKKIYLANRWAGVWPQYIRVTVGTKEEMTKFNTALSQVIQEGPPKVAQAG